MPHRKTYLIQLHPYHDPDLNDATVKFVTIVLNTWDRAVYFERVLDDINDNVIGRFLHLLGPPSPTNPIRDAFTAYLTTSDALFNLSNIKDQS
jgi:hypothetical protein